MANWNEAVILLTGYASGETDFATRCGRLSAADMQTLEQLAVRIGSAMNEQQSMAVLLLEGHSDRQDLPGMTTEQRRASELDASTKRVASAYQWFQARIADAAGPPDCQDQWSRILLVPNAFGAATLINASPTSEQQRLQNRRVALTVRTLNLSTFPEPVETQSID